MSHVAGKSLDSYQLPFLEVVLDEMFAVLPEAMRNADDPAYPKTLDELAAQVQKPVKELDETLQKIVRLADGVEVGKVKSTDVVIDLGGLEPGELNERFAVWQAAQRVVVCAKDDGQAFSGAMFLRQKGIASAHFIPRRLHK